MNNKQTPGYAMALIGFGIIIYNALGYLLGWETHPAFTVIGITFLGAGMATARKK